ncbi:MAG: hypothetical protein GC186_18620 [Rhodobacteraceae bacterium]|nr:hypothetical protein [Paracoccaceae bacterium]
MDDLNEWEAAVDKLRAALARAIEHRGTEEHPRAMQHLETARDELDRVTRQALGERDTEGD